MLFSERSLWTMVHGIGLGGGALLALGATLFGMYLLRIRAMRAAGADPAAGPVAALAGASALMLWLTAIVGTYIVFPPYRATPPDGTTDLAAFPRALLLSRPETTWLHAFGMETKEHLPWIGAMLATAVAFVAWRHRERLVQDPHVRRMGAAFLAICFAAVAWLSLLGVFVNKVAPLE